MITAFSRLYLNVKLPQVISIKITSGEIHSFLLRETEVCLLKSGSGKYLNQSFYLLLMGFNILAKIPGVNPLVQIIAHVFTHNKDKRRSLRINMNCLSGSNPCKLTY